jgi:hypothetical protein
MLNLTNIQYQLAKDGTTTIQPNEQTGTITVYGEVHPQMTLNNGTWGSNLTYCLTNSAGTVIGSFGPFAYTYNMSNNSRVFDVRALQFGTNKLTVYATCTSTGIRCAISTFTINKIPVYITSASCLGRYTSNAPSSIPPTHKISVITDGAYTGADPLYLYWRKTASGSSWQNKGIKMTTVQSGPSAGQTYYVVNCPKDIDIEIMLATGSTLDVAVVRTASPNFGKTIVHTCIQEEVIKINPTPTLLDKDIKKKNLGE